MEQELTNQWDQDVTYIWLTINTETYTMKATIVYYKFY